MLDGSWTCHLQVLLMALPGEYTFPTFVHSRGMAGGQVRIRPFLKSLKQTNK